MATTKAAQTPLETLKAEYDKKLREELEKQLQPENLRAVVSRIVHTQAVEVVAVALGATNRWGRWEYESHDRSALAKELKQYALDEAKKAIPAFIEQFTKNTATGKAITKAVRERYLEVYEDRLLELAKQIGEDNAEADMKAAEALLRSGKDTDNG